MGPDRRQNRICAKVAEGEKIINSKKKKTNFKYKEKNGVSQ